jgi:hypothetical protein
MNPNFPKIWSSIFGDFKASSNLIVKNIKSKGRTCMGRMLYCVFFWAVLGSALCTLHSALLSRSDKFWQGDVYSGLARLGEHWSFWE